MSGPAFGSQHLHFNIDIDPCGKIEEVTSGFKLFDRNTIIKPQNLTPLEETINSGRKNASKCGEG